MPLIDRLRSHTQSLKPAAKQAQPGGDESAVRNEWQTLYCQHFSSHSDPTAATIPRFHFPSTSPSSAPASDDHSTDKFRQASRHSHLQRQADRLLTDAELNELCQRVIQQHPPASRRHSLSSRDGSHTSASVTSTSLDHSSTFASQAPALHDIHLSYTRFLALASVLPVQKRAHHINARTFALFPRTTSPPAGISALLLLSQLLYGQQTSRLRVQLSFYDDQCSGHLSEEQLMNYVYDDMGGQAELAGLDRDFAPFYVFSVIRKIVFFVDAARRGRMSVRELAHSSLMHEWEQRKAPQPAATAESTPMDALRQALALAASSASAAGLLSVGATTLSSNLFSCTDPGRLNTSSSASTAGGAARPSWFSVHSSQAVYALYLSLDRDQNGMLSQAELAHFQSGAYTAQLLDALYATVALYPSATTTSTASGTASGAVLEMDYKGFLDFVLAVEYCHTVAALTYWFRLLDYRCVGYLDAACVRYWYRAVRQRLQELGHEQLPALEVVQSEVFDMVGPRELGGGDRITLRDLIESKCGHTVVQILVNVTGFWRYDHRETLLQQQQQHQ